MKSGLRLPPFKSDSPSSKLDPPFSALQYYIWSPETVLMVKWMRDPFELDQPYKQKKKNASNREHFEQ